MVGSDAAPEGDRRHRVGRSRCRGSQRAWTSHRFQAHRVFRHHEASRTPHPTQQTRDSTSDDRQADNRPSDSRRTRLTNHTTPQVRPPTCL